MTVFNNLAAAEKRRVLADLMAKKGSSELAKEGLYKIDYTEGGKEYVLLTYLHELTGYLKGVDGGTKAMYRMAWHRYKLTRLQSSPPYMGVTYLLFHREGYHQLGQEGVQLKLILTEVLS